MKYILKRELLAMKPSYKISDCSQNELYKVKGSFIGRERFDLFDLNNQVIATCKTNVNVMSVVGLILKYNLKKYRVSVANEEILTLARSLNIFSFNFNVKSSEADLCYGMGATGSYQFKYNEQTVCDIEKKSLTVGGAEYHIEIDDTQDQKAFLLIAIALDRIC